jgi:hypothetical protein
MGQLLLANGGVLLGTGSLQFKESLGGGIPSRGYGSVFTTRWSGSFRPSRFAPAAPGVGYQQHREPKEQGEGSPMLSARDMRRGQTKEGDPGEDGEGISAILDEQAVEFTHGGQ